MLTSDLKPKVGNSTASYTQLEISKMLESKGSVTYYNYRLDQNAIYIRQDNTSDFQKLADLIYIDHCIQDYNTEKVFVELVIKANHQLKKQILPMKSLHPSELLSLNDFGYPMSMALAKLLSTYLLTQVKLVPFEIHYDTIGFLQKEPLNKPVYALAKTYGNVDGKNFNVHSQLAKFLLDKRGTLEGWKGGVKLHVIGRTPLEFVLAISFSAFIIGYKKTIHHQNLTSITHLVGLSTTGKSSASLLAVSVYGKPAKEQGSLYQSFNATENAFINKLGGNFGVCYVLDEFSMSSIKNTTSLIYTIAEGFDKDRLDEFIRVRETVSWSTSIITNGENSILEASNRNLGLEVRLQEYKNKAWTNSARHAEQIFEFIHENYGHAGEAMAAYAAENWAMIDEKVESWKKYFLKYLPATPIKNRLAPRFAMVPAALEIAGEALDLTFNVEAVADFIIENEMESAAERDPADWIFAVTKDYVSSNLKHFEMDGSPSTEKLLYGKIAKYDKHKFKVNIKANYLLEELESLGYSNTSVLFKALKKKPYFRSELNRQTTRTLIAGVKEVTYEFLIPKEDLMNAMN